MSKDVVSGDDVLRACGRAARAMIDKRGELRTGILATEKSAGFAFPPGQKRGHREGLQVFVKVVRYSDDLRRAKPLTGGLLTEA